MKLTAFDIAGRVASDITDGSYVNLGIGTSMLVSKHISPGRGIVIHSDNGMLGMGPTPAEHAVDLDIINAAKQPVTMLPGGSYLHHADSAVGGAMDLVTGAKRVWVMFSSHVNKQGETKIVERCALPLTGVACVDRIYSDLAVIDVTADGLRVTDIVEGLTEDELQSVTGAPLVFANPCRILAPTEIEANR